MYKLTFGFAQRKTSSQHVPARRPQSAQTVFEKIRPALGTVLNPVQVLESADAMLASVGAPLGVSDWLPLAHGHAFELDTLTTVMAPEAGVPVPASVKFFLSRICDISAIKGSEDQCERLRFAGPMPAAGARVRASGQLLASKQLPDGGVYATIRVVLEAEGMVRPVCVADITNRYYFETRPAMLDRKAKPALKADRSPASLDVARWPAPVLSAFAR